MSSKFTTLPGALVAFVAFVEMAAAIAAAPAAPSDPGTVLLPEGKDRALVLRTCALCHSIDLVVSKHRTQEQWDQLIGVMVDRGAQATDEEQVQILEYLVRNFGAEDPPSPGAPAANLP